MNIRTPHTITLISDNGTGTPSKPNYTAINLTGVKFDEITAFMINRFGYSSADKARVIIYLQDVQPQIGWEVKKKDYFVFGDVAYNGNIADLKKTHTVYMVSQVSKKTNSVPFLHHIEVTGG